MDEIEGLYYKNGANFGFSSSSAGGGGVGQNKVKDNVWNGGNHGHILGGVIRNNRSANNNKGRETIRQAAEQRRSLSSSKTTLSWKDKREAAAMAAMKRRQLNDNSYCLPCHEVIELLHMDSDETPLNGEQGKQKKIPKKSSSPVEDEEKLKSFTDFIIIDDDNDEKFNSSDDYPTPTNAIDQQKKQHDSKQRERIKRSQNDAVSSKDDPSSRSSSLPIANTLSFDHVEIVHISSTAADTTIVSNNTKSLQEKETKKGKTQQMSSINRDIITNGNHHNHDGMRIIDIEKDYDTIDNDNLVHHHDDDNEGDEEDDDESTTTIDLTNFVEDEHDSDDRSNIPGLIFSSPVIDTTTIVPSSYTTTIIASRLTKDGTASAPSSTTTTIRKHCDGSKEWSCHMCTRLNEAITLS
eukprot:7365085-Ditylum_brightwellii.AAC.1